MHKQRGSFSYVRCNCPGLRSRCVLRITCLSNMFALKALARALLCCNIVIIAQGQTCVRLLLSPCMCGLTWSYLQPATLPQIVTFLIFLESSVVSLTCCFYLWKGRVGLQTDAHDIAAKAIRELLVLLCCLSVGLLSDAIDLVCCVELLSID